MKKLFTFMLLAAFALAMNAQRYMRVNKIDGSVVEFPISIIDSIDFFEKDTIVPPVIDPNNPVENGHEYVDLGLPSGILWATMNVGAKSITDSGDSFAWGETQTKENYTLDNYRFYTSETVKDADGFETTTYSYTKYCIDENYGPVDNLTKLELADDAAHVYWCGAWQMPTQNAFNELIHQCTWSWVALNGVNGYKVVGPNGKYVFFPATTEYWSASLNRNDMHEAYYFYLYSNNSHISTGS